MDINEFEARYREEMDIALNQLQSVILLLAELNHKTQAVGEAIQTLSQAVEDFIETQRQST